MAEMENSTDIRLQLYEGMDIGLQLRSSDGRLCGCEEHLTLAGKTLNLATACKER